MIDLCLDEEFIRLEKRDGYPILLFAERGLAIDIELAAGEFLEKIGEKVFSGRWRRWWGGFRCGHWSGWWS